MQTILLYRYIRPDGGVTVSPIKPDCDFTLTYRLVAEEGMLLTKEGQEPTPCIDTDVTDGWSEIEEVTT